MDKPAAGQDIQDNLGSLIKKSDYILRKTVYKEKNDIHVDQKLLCFGIDGNIYFLASATQEYQVSVHIEQYPSSATVSNHNIVKCCNTSFILNLSLLAAIFIVC